MVVMIFHPLCFLTLTFLGIIFVAPRRCAGATEVKEDYGALNTSQSIGSLYSRSSSEMKLTQGARKKTCIINGSVDAKGGRQGARKKKLAFLTEASAKGAVGSTPIHPPSARMKECSKLFC